jgi:uncharacterized sulfatase
MTQLFAVSFSTVQPFAAQRPAVPLMGLVLALLLVISPRGWAADQVRPNILWISCEDISPHLGCYGDPHAITPNLNALATQGVRFSHAYTTAGVCAPCRSGIITGMYQNSIGTHHMRCDARLPDWLRPFPMLMRESGYYCTNNSKTDYQFSRPTSQQIWDHSGRDAHWKNRSDKSQPFFAVFNFTGCHESGIAGDQKYREVTRELSPDQRQDASRLTTLPPYYPDTPTVREDWKRNYELITAMDAWAGNLIEELKAEGVDGETIVFFWSDHGVGLPRAKRWLYESGTHIPLIVRIPEKFRVQGQGQPSSVDSQLVSSVDFGPTVLNLAGVAIPDYIQGRAFLGTGLTAPRRYIFGARDRMDERYDIIRAVRDQRFRYIRNFEPLKPYYQYMNTPEKGATMGEIRKAEKAGSLTPTGSLFSGPRKPVEELYDVANDPHEIHNLADDPDYASRLREMRAALAQWQNEIGDLGLIPEAEIERIEQQVGSRYQILRSGPDPAKTLGRLVEIATEASMGMEQYESLVAGLKSPDAAVRYWAATGLGNIGSDATSALPEILAATEDPSSSVRIAAARAAARMGEVERALTVLEAELVSEHQWGRLAATIVLDEMDDSARPAVEALKAALVDQPNKYIVRVANRALNELLGTNQQVP